MLSGSFGTYLPQAVEDLRDVPCRDYVPADQAPFERLKAEMGG